MENVPLEILKCCFYQSVLRRIYISRQLTRDKFIWEVIQTASRLCSSCLNLSHTAPAFQQNYVSYWNLDKT